MLDTLPRSLVQRPLAAPYVARLCAAARQVGAWCRGRIVLERVTLPVPDLPEALRGLRLLHVSDLHLCARDGETADAVRAFANLGADLTVVTGDLIEEDAAIPLAVGVVRDLASPLGSFVVLGNHDYVTHRFRRGMLRRCVNDVPQLCATLGAGGATVLRNAWATVQARGHALHLVGVDDPHLRRADVRQATRGLPADGPRLLLSHSPDVLPQAKAHGLLAVLAGHTHGGQIVLPLVGAVKTATRVRLPRPAGLVQWHGVAIYVSRGVSGAMPIRLNCPPEVALIELVPATPAL